MTVGMGWAVPAVELMTAPSKNKAAGLVNTAFLKEAGTRGPA